jgi:uncharacterized protein
VTTLLFAGAVFLAFVVEAATGFGGTIVTVTLASHLLPVEEVLATFVPVNVLLSAYLAIRHRDAIAWRLLGRQVVPFMGAGVAVGIALFQLRAEGWLRTAFAAFVVLLAAIELARPRRPSDRPLRPAAARLLLLGAGLIHGLFACGGPMAVYVLSRELDDKRAFRSTLAVIWLLFNLVLVPSYALAGHVTAATLRGSVILLGALLLGVVAGEWAHGRIAPARFRVAVNVLLLVAGGALLVRS